MYASVGFFKMTRYTSKEVIGRNWSKKFRSKWKTGISSRKFQSQNMIVFYLILVCICVCVQVGFCFKNIINTDSVKNCKNCYIDTVLLNFKPSAMFNISLFDFQNNYLKSHTKG
ncbi:hypothetical protein GLYMA_17G207750v4 [Glycine max]|nr:hypothetical protein GLYMA_17G207750v4 [Glycine max]KAH1119363.1 hypothetical protein GYH30_047953 [Glycine max]